MANKDIELEPKNLEVLAYIKGDPNCKHCYGKGYLSISLSGLVFRCRCAIITEPMTAKIMANQAELLKTFQAINERLEVMESRFIRTKILNLFKRAKK